MTFWNKIPDMVKILTFFITLHKNVNLVTFIEEILNGNLYFLCNVIRE